MSVESIRRGALIQTVAAKLVTEAVCLVSHTLHALADGIEEFADCAFYVETDGAQRYKNLTGTDLGLLTGDPERYLPADPGYERVEIGDPEFEEEWDEDDDE